MLLVALGCSLPPASPAADSAAPDETAAVETWDICHRSLEGDASGTYYVDGDRRGGCAGQIELWCDDGIRGRAELECDGSLSSLTLVLEGVQVRSELGGRVAITGEDDTVLADWAANVAPDLSVMGGFTTAGEELDGHYGLSGAFALGMPSSL